MMIEMVPRMRCSARTCIHNTDTDPSRPEPACCGYILKELSFPGVTAEGRCREFRPLTDGGEYQ